MAIQSSGAVSLSEIQAEFGGSNPVSLSEYYRGGSYVTDNNTGVPTSGEVSLAADFYGTAKTVSMTYEVIGGGGEGGGGSYGGTGGSGGASSISGAGVTTISASGGSGGAAPDWPV